MCVCLFVRLFCVLCWRFVFILCVFVCVRSLITFFVCVFSLCASSVCKVCCVSVLCVCACTLRRWVLCLIVVSVVCFV